VLCANEIVGHDAVPFWVSALCARNASGGPEVCNHPNVRGAALPVVGVWIVMRHFRVAVQWNDAAPGKVFHGACDVDDLRLIGKGAEWDEIAVFWFVFFSVRGAAL